ATLKDGFQLRIAFETLRHGAHGRARGLEAGSIAFLILAVAGGVELLPALHETIRTAGPIGAPVGLKLKGADSAVDPACCRFLGEFWILLVGGFGVVRTVGPHLLEGPAGLLQFLRLLRAGPAALLLHLEDRVDRARVPDERSRAGLAQHRFRV